MSLGSAPELHYCPLLQNNYVHYSQFTTPEDVGCIHVSCTFPLENLQNYSAFESSCVSKSNGPVNPADQTLEMPLKLITQNLFYEGGHIVISV